MLHGLCRLTRKYAESFYHSCTEAETSRWHGRFIVCSGLELPLIRPSATFSPGRRCRCRGVHRQNETALGQVPLSVAAQPRIVLWIAETAGKPASVAFLSAHPG